MTMSLMMSFPSLTRVRYRATYGYSSHPEEADLISRLLDAGEGLEIEYKRCRDLPHDDTFETICSFANSQGGTFSWGGGITERPKASMRHAFGRSAGMWPTD